ncbi:prolipoprotein diacylglyceryl transferase [Granulicoccus sp. GXG6511]|uniref:prolipoprotein diacylglyceryl transferase n=1 Tax=Granulicoccus sp. GXG6511 TaxID=3381351 RepID=UPI003D7E6429
MNPLVLHFPDIDPVAFRLGPLTVHWYAVMYLLGFGLGYVLLRARLKHEPFNRIVDPKPWTRDTIEDLLFVAITGVIVGGRLGYCLFYKPAHYLANPLEILYLWEGGMSFHGGALGVIIGMIIYAWRTKRPLLEVADFLVPAIPTGLAAGRLGNFINGELWGRVASPELPWAMIFPAAGPDPRHPSQIYQLLGEGLLLAALLWAYARRERPRGAVSAAFLVGYGVFRFAAEFFREPDDFLGTLGLGLTMGQWLSVPMILGGLALWLWARRFNIHPPIAVRTPTSRVAADDAEADADSAGSDPAASDPAASDWAVSDPAGTDGQADDEPEHKA